ncbi:flavin-dependent oxidoreductase [Virgisporangium aliadipatigenens]|uniref:Flavin-dependent oxidoreductase n=1 Tax=Virgisporangium aliadipatigenens TaxID=741659 RepID=A0A8J3YR80_9ACTN|nr:FAD-dependent monooxygenase [Virgisporangium aliadipatigenens]GIJ50359.1 flavin-dependent oxidoreductase [Virgisporangium aliadipatigenens]
MQYLIIGGGIAGLTAALSLHAAGVRDVTVFEAVDRMAPAGAGVNLLPNATRELAALDLHPALARISVATSELRYYNRHGHVLWRESRGRAAGHRWPQFSVHRGRLQMLLLSAVRARLGSAAVRTGTRLTGFTTTAAGRVRATVRTVDGSTATVEADALIGADGIRSAVRAVLYPDEGPPVWQRQSVWRGTVWAPPFGGGRSMVIGGDDTWKVIAYPMRPEPDEHGRLCTNWAVARLGDDPRRAEPDGPVPPESLLPAVGGWEFGSLDVGALISATPSVYRQRMVDRDPLSRWSFGPVTLIGDAAHAMCPMGSNGTTQSVLDARALAHAVVSHREPVTAFAAYEADRRATATRLQRAGRELGPEIVIALAHRHAPDGGAALPRQEFAEAVHRYALLGGSDVTAANAPSPYQPPRQRRSWADALDGR